MLDQDGNLDAGLEKLLQNILVEANNTNASERVTVKYYANEASVPFQIKGRVYAQGLQTVPGWVRRQCAHKYYHDIDIVNCYPVILLQLQEKVGVR